jgi:hypothetical protein
MSEWYYLLNGPGNAPNTGAQKGPVPWDDLQAAFSSGSLGDASMVWGPGLESWTAIQEAPDVKAKLETARAAAAAPPPPRPVPVVPAKQYAAQMGRRRASLNSGQPGQAVSDAAAPEEGGEQEGGAAAAAADSAPAPALKKAGSKPKMGGVAAMQARLSKGGLNIVNAADVPRGKGGRGRGSGRGRGRGGAAMGDVGGRGSGRPSMTGGSVGAAAAAVVNNPVSRRPSAAEVAANPYTRQNYEPTVPEEAAVAPPHAPVPGERVHVGADAHRAAAAPAAATPAAPRADQTVAAGGSGRPTLGTAQSSSFLLAPASDSPAAQSPRAPVVGVAALAAQLAIDPTRMMPGAAPTPPAPPPPPDESYGSLPGYGAAAEEEEEYYNADGYNADGYTKAQVDEWNAAEAGGGGGGGGGGGDGGGGGVDDEDYEIAVDEYDDGDSSSSEEECMASDAARASMAAAAAAAPAPTRASTTLPALQARATQSAATPGLRSELDKSEQAALLSIAGNDMCVDCMEPTGIDAEAGAWASATYGAIFCTTCSGLHRSLGDDRVLSLVLDKWTHEQVEAVRLGGNRALRSYFARNGVDPHGSIQERYTSPQAHVYRATLVEIVAGRVAAPDDLSVSTVSGGGLSALGDMAGVAPVNKKMEGPLSKRGQKNKAWKQRHFYLEDGTLYYSAGAGVRAKGGVPLAGVVLLCPPPPSRERMDSKDSLHLHYFLLASEGRLLHLAAPDALIMERWLGTLRGAIAFANALRAEEKDALQSAAGGKGLAMLRAQDSFALSTAECALLRAAALLSGAELEPSVYTAQCRNEFGRAMCDDGDLHFAVVLEKCARSELARVAHSDVGAIQVGSLVLGVSSGGGGGPGGGPGGGGGNPTQATHQASFAETSYAWAEAPRERALALRLLRAPHKEGTLVKRSRTQHHGRNWKRRYFVLSEGVLRYYEGGTRPTKGQKEAGSISLAECVACPTSEDRPHCLMLIRDSSDRLLVQAESDHVRDEWLSALHAAISVAQGTVPADSLDAINKGLPLLTRETVDVEKAPARQRKARVSLLDGKLKTAAPPPVPPPPSMATMEEDEED